MSSSAAVLPLDPRADVAEAAARDKLRDVVEAPPTSIRSDILVSEARRVFAEHALRAAPVIDGDGRLVGVLSRWDLVGSVPASTRVGDVMPPRVHALPDDAPVGYAIALMAIEQVNEVPVVTAAGEVVGLFHALDALGWTARRLGYIPTSDA